MDSVEKILSPTSASAQLRKIKKPLIEKRRRERINECLVQLKALVLEAMNKDGSQYNKMEKADILEMTVAHLKSRCGVTPTRPRAADSTDEKNLAVPVNLSISSTPIGAVHRYVTGYTECAVEVANYLSTCTGHAEPSLTVFGGDTVRRGLLEHLDSCLHRRTNRFTPIVNGGLSSTAVGQCLIDGSYSPRTVSERFETSPMSEGWGTDRLGEFVTRSAISSPIEDSSTCLSSMTRLRCDSGVYSGASSPTGSTGDEITTTASWPADWTTSNGVDSPFTASSSYFEHHHIRQSYHPKVDVIEDLVCRLHQHQQVFNLTTRPSVADSDVWRPW